jgi:hypothetical protein
LFAQVSAERVEKRRGQSLQEEKISPVVFHGFGCLLKALGLFLGLQR